MSGLGNQQERLLMICSYCNKKIQRKIGSDKLYRNEHFFCNPQCYHKWVFSKKERHPRWKGGGVKKVCLYCEKIFYVRKAIDRRGGGKYCSNICKGKYNAHLHTGENNLNWKGGVTKIHDRLRSSSDYQIWRLKVYRRDRFICQVCKNKSSRKNKLHAHHIFKFSEYLDIRFNVDNGITLCQSCHSKIKNYEEKMIPLFKSLIESSETNTPNSTSTKVGEDRVRTIQKCIELVG
ncbi:MAG: HNH endonuclease [Thermodesulfobacteriota bacterium]|nr:HNH endonuclease [Thermodesulfobacteriota bacterium]